ncbi:MAG: carboxypeptidase-like regulatory domain-containing protein [Acutalibacteraceae bacterium]|jgi:hypothetical protein
MSESRQEIERLIRDYSRELMRMRPPAAPGDTGAKETPPKEEPVEKEPVEEEAAEEEAAEEEAAEEEAAEEEAAVEVTIAPAPAATAFGHLQARLFAAGGALPVEGGTVHLWREDADDPDRSTTLITDREGFTLSVELPVGIYRLKLRADGFASPDALQVEVAEGVAALQPVELIPLPEDGQAL